MLNEVLDAIKAWLETINTWQAKKEYIAGHYLTSGSKFYECTTAGISGATIPTFPSTTVGQTVTDGTVVWTYRSTGTVFTVLSSEHALSMVNKTDYLSQYLKPEQFPLILLDFTEGEMTLKTIPKTDGSGVKYGYNFQGEIKLIERNTSLRQAVRNLNDNTFKKNKLIAKLFEIPKPKINGIYIREIQLGRAHTETINKDNDEVIFVSMVIPATFEIWL